MIYYQIKKMTQHKCIQGEALGRIEANIKYGRMLKKWIRY
jgi:hypothetical protein